MIFFNQLAAAFLVSIGVACCTFVFFLSSFGLAFKGIGITILFLVFLSSLLRIGLWKPRNNGIFYLATCLCTFLGLLGYSMLTVPSLRKIVAIPLSLVRMQFAIDNTGYSSLPSNTDLLFAYKKLTAYELIEQMHPKQNLNKYSLNHAKLLSHAFYYYRHDDLVLLLHEIFAAKNYAVKIDSPNPFIIDCGSNVGVSILFFKMLYPQSKIIGFEAGPDAFAALQQTVTANNFQHVELHNKAVWNQNTTLRIPAHNISDGTAVGSVLTTANDEEKIVEISCVKLSDYIDRDVDMLKVDIEGAESEVFEDLAKNNKLHFIKQMVIEFHNMAKDTSRQSLGSFLSLLDAHGFIYLIHSPIRTPFNIKDTYPVLIYATKK